MCKQKFIKYIAHFWYFQCLREYCKQMCCATCHSALDHKRLIVLLSRGQGAHINFVRGKQAPPPPKKKKRP